MRRRIAALLSAALVASTFAVLATSSPASASTTLCVGQGRAQVTPGLTYPITGAPTVTGNTVTVGNPATNAGFGFQFTPGLGACVPDLAKTLTAGGTLQGYCGHSVGSGTTNNGHRFAWTSAGSFLVLTGGLVGLVNAVPDALGGEGCSAATDPSGGGAQNFIVTGAVLLTFPCNVNKTKSTTLFGPLHQLILTLAHVTVNISVHLSAKVCTG